MPSGKYIRDENWKNKMREKVWNNVERNKVISEKHKGRLSPWTTKRNMENNPAKIPEIAHKISLAMKGNHNSIKTQFTSEKMQGKNNPQWKGGKKDILERYRNWKEYRNWRKQILQKYNFICQKCNVCVKGKNAHVHHLESYKKNPLRRLDLENGIVLCAKCHASETMKENKSKIMEGREKWLIAREETKLKGSTYA